MKPVTILVVPHSQAKTIRLSIPMAALYACVILSAIGAVFLISTGIRTASYQAMSNRVAYYTKEFSDLRSTMVSLKQANNELSRLLSFKGKREILESVTQDDKGSLDIDILKKQVNEAIEGVSAIRQFMAEEKDLYLATPAGWPVRGSISSGYGVREHPISLESSRHTGVDIRASTGSPVRATAGGIVSFAAWTRHSGYIVVLEHGHGFSTAYGHNSSLNVVVGQRVKKGERIALSGSTGISTGPHVHYEVWKSGKQVNPVPYLKAG